MLDSQKLRLICVTLVCLFICSCSLDGNNKNKSALKRSIKQLEEGINVKQDDNEGNLSLITKKPAVYSMEALTDEEIAKFSRPDSEKVPVVLAGNSSPETLKAYLTQPFLYLQGVRDDVAEEGGMMVAELAMADMAMPRMMKSASSANTLTAAPSDGDAPPVAEEFSGTNVQVEGVDEGDIWKYDGKNFYVLSKSQKIFYPYILEPMIDDAISIQPVPRPMAASMREQAISAGQGGVESNIAEPAPIDESADASNSTKLLACPDCDNQSDKANAKLRIVTQNAKELSLTDLGQLNPQELYLFNQRLILLGNQRPSRGGWKEFSHWQAGMIDIQVMDVANPEAPKDTLEIKIQGYLIKSRRIDDQLYVVSRYSPQLKNVNYYPRTAVQMDSNKETIKSLSINDMLPTISVDSVTSKLIQPNECWLTVMPKSQWGSPTLTLITKISITTGKYQSQCIGGDVEGIYMSQKSLYLYNTTYMTFNNIKREGVAWQWRQGNTHIHKLDLNNLEYKGSQLVDGVVGHDHASFRFGELKDGNLGVVTTKDEWREPEHRLTVLGDTGKDWQFLAMLPNLEKPKPIGKPGERIYSVRFMQDRAYIVTFQKTDPLYVIDLSQSERPIIAGELEIPGFSDYLHPVGTDKLLGIGKASAIGSNGVSYDQGVKVSLFNVADITNPQEVGYRIIGQRGSSTPLSNNHLAFAGLQQEEGYRFVLPIKVHEGYSSYNYNRDSAGIFHDWKHTGLFLFEIKEEALQHVGHLITDMPSDNKRYDGWEERRGLIQGDTVYHLKGDRIYSSNWNNPSAYKGPF